MKPSKPLNTRQLKRQIAQGKAQLEQLTKLGQGMSQLVEGIKQMQAASPSLVDPAVVEKMEADMAQVSPILQGLEQMGNGLDTALEVLGEDEAS